MSVATAEMIWTGVALYLGAGLVVGMIVALWGASATDHAAKGSGLGFRLLIIPGAMLLWPYMIARLLSGRKINAPIPRDGETRS